MIQCSWVLRITPARAVWVQSTVSGRTRDYRCACEPSMSGRCFLDECANRGLRRVVQRCECPRDGVYVGAFLASGVHDFAEAECDEVLVHFDVADVLAVLHVERESPADDRLE